MNCVFVRIKVEQTRSSTVSLGKSTVPWMFKQRWRRPRGINPLTSRPGCMPGSRYTSVGVLFFYLKLELLTQFPASNDEKYVNVVYIWRKFVSFYGYVHWRMTTEISVMYGSEKVNRYYFNAGSALWTMDLHWNTIDSMARIVCWRFNTAAQCYQKFQKKSLKKVQKRILWK